MSYTSLWFFVLFPLAVISYYLVPARFRTGWLLGLSWLYMASWGSSSLAVLLGVTLATYAAGRGLAAARTMAARRGLLAAGLCACAGFLFLRKGISLVDPAFSPVEAAGLAFYGLQAASYLVDVYRGRLRAQRNIFRYALYVSFFPRVLSGPIGRGSEFFPQLKALPLFDDRRMVRGGQQMLWGYLEKLVLADTLGVVVNTVFADPAAYSGTVLAVGAVAFGFQLYADFAGYSHIAIGAAEVLGVTLAPNFRQPYLAESLSGFWRRWHISLSSWLQDYIYIPLGGNRRGRGRKYLNLLATFLVSGLWHGTGVHYLFWGALHAGYQILGGMLKPFRARLPRPGPGSPLAPVARWGRRLFVFVLVDLAWVFFRAPTLGAGFSMLGGILTRQHPADLWNGALLGLGLSLPELEVLAVVLVAVAAADLLREQGADLPRGYAALPRGVRWAGYLVLSLLVLLFALRTVGGSAAGFYYAAF